MDLRIMYRLILIVNIRVDNNLYILISYSFKHNGALPGKQGCVYSYGKLYGAITNQEVADCISQNAGVALDKRKISFDTIKSTGNYEIRIKLHPQVEAKVFLVVEAAD